jgi:5-methylcytosine-specific restriction enzyme subunit McrC
VSHRILELREEELGWFPRSDLQDAEIITLNRTGKFEIEGASLLNGYKYGIRSRGWVGHIPIGDNLLIRVVPKVAVSNLFRMLEVAYNLRSFRILEGETGVETIEDLYERVVSILARRILDRARKGLYRTYVGEADELPFVRGSIDPVATVLNTFRGVPRIPCSYHEHTADLEDNRILLWTLHQVRRQALKQSRVKRELDLARRALAGTITLERCSAADCVGRIYDRLNDDYAPMHGLCRFILEHSGPGIRGGDRTFIPFELNMPRLFEAFVAAWMRANPPKGMIVRCQHNAQLDANFEMNIHIDILLLEEGSDRPVAILDTKYKVGEIPAEADIYQVAFYARELQVERAMLVYPSKSSNPFRIRHGKGVVLESLVFDISASLDRAGEECLNDLSRRLQLDGVPGQSLRNDQEFAP